MKNSFEALENRKKDHLRIASELPVSYQAVSNGFERYHFVHNALPEIDLSEVLTTSEFFGYQLDLPFMICAISGGESESARLNQALAEVAQKERVALELGSLRPALENPDRISTYQVAREAAPDVPIVANLGAVQLKSEVQGNRLATLLEKIGADALSVHLNPMHEALQPEGQTDFRNVSETIELIKEIIPQPIIVKEVGFGLSHSVIRKLKKIGVQWIDVAGAGGTSWARIEEKRAVSPEMSRVAHEFFEWGIPTAEALVESVHIRNCHLIASGGIRSGLECAKALALGAAMVGSAAPILTAFKSGGKTAIETMVRSYRETLRIAMFCTGCSQLEQFRGNSDIIYRR